MSTEKTPGQIVWDAIHDSAIDFSTGTWPWHRLTADERRVIETAVADAHPAAAGDEGGTSTARFPIYAKFAYPGNGYSGDQEQCAEYLTPGKTYLIDRMDVGSSHTIIRLHEVPGEEFNQVMFAAGTEEEWADGR